MRPIKWLSWLALLGALAFGGWRAWLWGTAAWEGASTQAALVARLDGEVKALRQRSIELNRRETGLALSAQKNGGDLAALDARMDAGEQTLAKLGDAVEGGRTRLQLASVEQLMLSAADRLQLSHDNSGALEALDLADQRLALLNDPRLFKVREALARDMNVPFLGQIPIYEPIRIGGDTGIPICVGEPKSPAAESFRAAADQLATQLSVQSFKQEKRPIPLTQVR